jgi:hypothetical protein
MLTNLILNGFKVNRQRNIFFVLAVLSGLICIIFTCLHYTNIYYGNNVMWISWLLGMCFLLCAFAPSATALKNKLYSYKIATKGVFASLSVFFFATHFWNFSTAPWNQNGLFDDAAWDIFFSKTHIFTKMPFQAAFFDDVGKISREVIYHYYITIFFKLFGYNLLVFNISLAILGFTTFIFTCMLIQKLFKNYIVTIVAAIIFNFYPMQYLQIFAGHRYAIAAPLMMSSIYFVYTGFKNKSGFKIVLGAILASLCLDSAVMGKQYLLGLLGAVILSLLFNFKKSFTKKNWDMVKLFTVSLVISSVPIVIYILFNPVYFRHENQLTTQFLQTYSVSGISGIKAQYWDRLMNIMFGEHTYLRWFSPEAPALPIAYCIFMVPGLVIAFLKKRFEIIILAILPVFGAFISEAYDMRFLHAIPFWIILIAFTLSWILNLDKIKVIGKYIPKHVVSIIALIILMAGAFPGISYLYAKSEDPNSIHLLPQRDVAVSRFVRDIVAGVPKPSTDFKWQEFNKLKGIPEPDYDTLVCQGQGYAITHVFLQDYGDDQIMSFSGELPFNILSQDEILNDNVTAIQTYMKTYKDLKLIWEITDQTKRIIDEFKKLNYLGTDEVLSSKFEGKDFSFYVLNIKNLNIDELKQKVTEISIH